MNINQYFKDIPLRSRMTQAEFGRQLGVTQQQVQHWIAGRQQPNARHVLAIEKMTKRKITRYELRPDVFGEKPIRKRRAA
jgi:DNA-binding transcriptional regulator YdaS (Cro superfamily)